jgi:hypothetical protein
MNGPARTLEEGISALKGKVKLPGDVQEGTNLKVLKVLGILMLTALGAAACGEVGEEGKDIKGEVEKSLKGLNAAQLALICSTTVEGGTSGTIITDPESGDDLYFPYTEDDWTKIPGGVKPWVWNGYSIESTSDFSAGTSYHKVFKYEAGEKKDKGQIDTFTHNIKLLLEDQGVVVVGPNPNNKVYKLTDEGDTVSATEIGDLPQGGIMVEKDGYILVNYIDDQQVERLVAIEIDPANPQNPITVVKDIEIYQGQSGLGSLGMAYAGGVLKIRMLDNKEAVFTDLPTGIDWMDNFQQFLDIQQLGFTSTEAFQIGEYTYYKVSFEQMRIRSLSGEEYTLNYDELPEGKQFRDITPTPSGIYLDTAGGPQFSIEPTDNIDDMFDPADFPFHVVQDPGPDTSKIVDKCSVLTPTEAAAAYPPVVNPEPNPEFEQDTVEEDILIQPETIEETYDQFDQLEEAGILDTEVWDVDPEDVIPDTEQETTPDVEKPDTDPPETVEEVIDPPEAVEEIVDPPDTENPDIAKPETTPDKDTPQNPDETNEEDIPEEDLTANPEPEIKGKKSDTGCTVSDKPLSPKGARGMAATAVISLMGLVGLRRRKEDDDDTIKKAA